MQPYKEYQELLMNYIRPKTVPLGLCLLRSKAEIPETSMIISKISKVTPSICQLVSIARHEEIIIAAIRPYMSCAPGMICVGMIKIPNKNNKVLNDSFSDTDIGDISKGLYTESTILGHKLGKKTEIIEGDDFEAIIVAPLELFPIPPSIILQYASPSQVLKLIRGYVWKTGEPVTMSCTGRAGLCSGAIAECFNRDKPVISIPSGENQLGLAEDNEVIMAIPIRVLSHIISGLKAQEHIKMLKYPPSPYLANYSQLNTGLVPIAGKSYERALIKALIKYKNNESHL